MRERECDEFMATAQVAPFHDRKKADDFITLRGGEGNISITESGTKRVEPCRGVVAIAVWTAVEKPCQGR